MTTNLPNKPRHSPKTVWFPKSIMYKRSQAMIFRAGSAASISSTYQHKSAALIREVQMIVHGCGWALAGLHMSTEVISQKSGKENALHTICKLRSRQDRSPRGLFVNLYCCRIMCTAACQRITTPPLPMSHTLVSFSSMSHTITSTYACRSARPHAQT